MESVLIAGRHFDKNGSMGIDPVLAWAQFHQHSHVALAIAPEDKSGAATDPNLKSLADVLIVSPWVTTYLQSGQLWTPALNALINAAAQRGKKYIAFVSTGARLSQKGLQQLVDVLSSNEHLLCAGPFTDKHLAFSQGLQKLSGAAIPWNSTCLWKMEHLAKFGFLLISDGTQDPKIHGVEEAPITALLNKLYGCQSVLVKGIDGYKWKDESALGAQYMNWTVEKYASKHERPARQIEAMGLEATDCVWHYELGSSYPWSVK